MSRVSFLKEIAHEPARPPEGRIPPWGDGAQRQGGGMSATGQFAIRADLLDFTGDPGLADIHSRAEFEI